ncbi:SRPBCC family protein [Donghicola sp. C2-DW-16]|uniref:SRPBCC family protein n=1 Tax=Donghicola mangrovi TaxID=2729614 RepID=A0A850Q8I7_9RHOB|nr:SRPBCC family protein [Donghicola mangrovi]NVO24542.1 SRPBCC family protein [Donghicola mangrovi]NVO28771.1 SRPBCC family protein [Donghicola mangrovi]
MKFSTREDIDLPIDQVFAQVSDLDQFERAALRRGVKIRRLDDSTQPKVGMAWEMDFVMRGKERHLDAQLTGFDAPNGMTFEGKSGGMTHHLMVDLTPLSKKRTRLQIELDLKPRTLPARLLIQSFKLAKQSLNKKFKQRIASFARDVEKAAAR